MPPRGIRYSHLTLPGKQQVVCLVVPIGKVVGDYTCLTVVGSGIYDQLMLLEWSVK